MKECKRCKNQFTPTKTNKVFCTGCLIFLRQLAGVDKDSKIKFTEISQ